ncbi:MAG: hypothetical protein M3044_15750, partial [Thermoproteota archaeon]|nr:hypothetical protein [Thermoproteota archaeon]
MVKYLVVRIPLFTREECMGRHSPFCCIKWRNLAIITIRRNQYMPQDALFSRSIYCENTSMGAWAH